MAESEIEDDDTGMSDSSKKWLQPTFEDVVAGRAVAPEMLRDLYAISQLETAKVASTVDALGNLGGLGSHEDIENTIQGILGDTPNKDTPKSIRRAINSLTPDSIPDVIESLEKWVQAKVERNQYFSPKALITLSANLNVLITNNGYGKLMRKAERLLRDVGNEFRGIKFVCDLRPVFDDKREHVNAFVVVANMRIRYVSQCGEQQCFELALTEDELVRMKKDVETALKKVEVLKPVRASLTLPNSSQDDA